MSYVVMSTALSHWKGERPGEGEIVPCPACGRRSLVFLSEQAADAAVRLIGRCRRCGYACVVP